MSQTAITSAFEQYLAQQTIAAQPVVLDEFIFANVPGLDPDTPIDPDETISDADIVWRQAVDRAGVINGNAVVYSVLLGTSIGDFTFNCVGLANAETGMIAMITHIPPQDKYANSGEIQGNALTRSFVMEYDGAEAATAINVPAETWQIDFSARMSAMDERVRAETVDIYGVGAFIGDAFLVSGDAVAGYVMAPGTGYVGGLRVALASEMNIAATGPTKVWIDAKWQGTSAGPWASDFVITFADELEDYIADGYQHFVFAVADIAADGTVTDLRPIGTADGGQQSGKYLHTANNLSEIADAGEAAQADARKNLALGTAATLDATTSTTDNTVGRVLKVGDRGLGLTAINPTGIDFNSYQFAAGETLFLKMADCTNIPAGIDTGYVVYAYVNVIGVRNVNNNVGILIGDNGGARYYWAVRSTNSSGVTSWLVRILPQSASDIDALPITGGDLTGPLNLHNRLNMYTGSHRDADGYGLIECFDANDVLAMTFGYYDDAFNLYFYDEAGEYRVNALTIGSNANMTVRGNLSGVALFEGAVRVYSPNNPPPLVQKTRFGANLSASWGSNGGTVPAGCALTGGDFNSENEYPIYAYMQYLINGSWINASGGVGAESRVSASHYKTVPENGISSLINLRPYLRESNDPVDLPGVPHFIDDAGYDWFEAAPKLTGRVFIAVAPDAGVIVQIADSSLPDTDAFSLYPDGVSVYGLEALPPDCSIDGTWRFDSETLTAYRDAELAAARRLAENTRLRTQFATQAMLAISTLQNRVSIGRARAGDADALAAWQNYLIDLDELTDAQLSAPDFVFPPTPELNK